MVKININITNVNNKKVATDLSRISINSDIKSQGFRLKGTVLSSLNSRSNNIKMFLQMCPCILLQNSNSQPLKWFGKTNHFIIINFGSYVYHKLEAQILASTKETFTLYSTWLSKNFHRLLQYLARISFLHTLQLFQFGKEMTDWASGYSSQHQWQTQMPAIMQQIKSKHN